MVHHGRQYTDRMPRRRRVTQREHPRWRSCDPLTPVFFTDVSLLRLGWWRGGLASRLAHPRHRTSNGYILCQCYILASSLTVPLEITVYWTHLHHLPTRERDREAHLNYYISAYNRGIQLSHHKTKLNQILHNEACILN